MPHKIKDIEVYYPIFRAEKPAFDSSFILKTTGNAVVRVVTEDGLDGYGMTFAEPVGEYISRTLKEEVIGKDPLLLRISGTICSFPSGPRGAKVSRF
jgi:D-galactarolactone cycloisomerase